MMLVGNGERASEGGLRGEGACNRLQGLGDKGRIGGVGCGHV